MKNRRLPRLLTVAVLVASVGFTSVSSGDDGFVRGNTNMGEGVDLSDGVFILGYIFLGSSAPACASSADVDDNGFIELTDAVYLFNFLFLGGRSPPAPFPECGADPTPDRLGCEEPQCPLSRDLAILDIEPREGGEGTVVRITGTGFPDDPCDLCLSVAGGPVLRAFSVSPEEGVAFARVGPVPPRTRGGTVGLVVGQGEFFSAEDMDARDGVNLSGDYRVFHTPGVAREVGSDLFFTTSIHSPRAVSSTFVDGTGLCFTLQGDWRVGDKIDLDIHLRYCYGPNTQWCDLTVNEAITIVANFDGDQCAAILCQVIQALMAVQQNCVITCDLTGNKITITSVNGEPLKPGSYGTIDVRQSCECPPANADLNSWNQPGTQAVNNCYNYATNMQTNTFAQPGRAAAMQYQILQCNDAGGMRGVRSAAIADGLTPVSSPNGCPAGECVVALVVAPNCDYHWYRRNANGKWSHKPGGTAATTLDASGNIISDPATADRNYSFCNYSDFCGYFCVDWNDVTVAIGPEGDGAGDQPGPEIADISILRFFGREDPGWSLTTQADIVRLRRFLEQLPRVSDPEWQDHLGGYRGFRISFRTRGRGVTESIRVRDERIQLHQGDCLYYYDDVAGLEDFLRKEAESRRLGRFLEP